MKDINDSGTMKFNFWSFVDDVIRDKDILTYVGLILIAITASFYGLYRPNTISQSDTQSLVVVIDSKPDYDEPNGDNVPNISFKSVGYSSVFDISHCALSLININDILSLNVGDSLSVTVDKQDLLEARSSITVCGVDINDKGTNFNLDDYNSCEKYSWRKIYYLGTLFTVVLILTILWKIIKHLKNNG